MNLGIRFLISLQKQQLQQTMYICQWIRSISSIICSFHNARLVLRMTLIFFSYRWAKSAAITRLKSMINRWWFRKQRPNVYRMSTKLSPIFRRLRAQKRRQLASMDCQMMGQIRHWWHFCKYSTYFVITQLFIIQSRRFFDLGRDWLFIVLSNSTVASGSSMRFRQQVWMRIRRRKILRGSWIFLLLFLSSCTPYFQSCSKQTQSWSLALIRFYYSKYICSACFNFVVISADAPMEFKIIISFILFNSRTFKIGQRRSRFTTTDVNIYHFLTIFIIFVIFQLFYPD